MTRPRLRLAVMRPCNCDSDSKSKPEEDHNQRKKCLATSAKNSTPLIRSFIDTAPTAHVLDHMTPSFKHQRAHVQGIICIYVTSYEHNDLYAL